MTNISILNFSSTLRAELAKLDDEQIATLLGEILEPSIETPFTMGDDLIDAMAPISAAYVTAYPLFCEPDPDAALWNEADPRYDERRDEA